jgi:hypothetical protein
VPIRDRLIDLEQRLKRLAGEPPPRVPLEIRQAILQGIVDLTEPTGRGRRVLPFDRVDVDVLAENHEARRVIEAVFAREDGLEASVRRALAAAACPVPPGFSVHVHYRKRLPAGWSDGQRFSLVGRVEKDTVSPAPASPPEAFAAAGGLPVVTLRPVKGKASRKVLEITSERINIGRGDEVVDRGQRLVRRNHLAFVQGDEAGDSVSRAHAHIRCAPSGECRLRDDNSAHGTRIVRAGRTIDVDAGNTRGVRLQPGDELHLGRAVVRVEIRSASRER